MSTRLGIAVGRDELRAVMVRGSRVVWHSRTTFAGTQAIGDALGVLTSSAPLGRWRKPRVGVVVGLAHSQVRRIEGLPPAQQMAVLTRIVRENAESFFLRLGARVVVTDLSRRPDGAVWAAAFDGALIDAILSTLRSRGFGRVTVVPYVAAIASVVDQGTHALFDDGIGVEMTVDRSELIGVRRIFDGATVVDAPQGVAGLGEEARDFVAAYSGTFASSASPFAWRAAPTPERERTAEGVRIATATAALILAIVGALIAPGLHAIVLTRDASREIAAAKGVQREMTGAEADLRRVSDQLDQIDRLRASRGRITMLLGALSQSLPDSTALVTLRVDTLDASFVALTPHAADIVPQLVSIDGVTAPRIVGSITRETLGNARLERATIRFRRRPSPGARSTALLTSPQRR